MKNVLFHWVVVCAVGSLLWLSGCHATPFVNPIAVMLDRDNGYNVRRAAAKQAQTDHADEKLWTAAMKELLWAPGYPNWQRRYAIDRLVEIDETRLRIDLADRILSIRDYETLEYIFEVAVKRVWLDFTPVAVRSYAKPMRNVPDAQRPERQAIQSLHPNQTVEDIVFGVLTNESGGNTRAEQVAAWTVMQRLLEPDELARIIDEAPNTNPLVANLQRAIRELYVLPRGAEGVLWLGYLLDDSRQALWNQMATLAAGLSTEQRIGLELRHLPVLTKADMSLLTVDRSSLIDQLQMLIGSGQQHFEIETVNGGFEAPSQRLEDWVDRLAWADLATLHQLAQGLRSRPVAEAMFTQADADYLDKNSEYGGVVDGESRWLTMHAYEPAIRQHDRKFHPPQKMIEHLYTGVAHYHFHAQVYDNERYAGPGTGDLGFADRSGFNCLVITFIDQNRLNIDYHHPGGVVIDLGTVYR